MGVKLGLGDYYLTRLSALDRHLKRLRKDINWPH